MSWFYRGVNTIPVLVVGARHGPLGIGMGPCGAWFVPKVSRFWCGPAECYGFSVEPPSALFLAWVQYYTDFSIGGPDMDRGVEGG